MNYGKKNIILKILFLFISIVLIFSILYLPFVFSFLTDLEVIFILSLFIAFAIYSKIIIGYWILIILLNKIDNDEEINDYVKDNLSKDILIKLIKDGNLLLVVEKQLLDLSRLNSILFDIFVIYLLLMFILSYLNVVSLDIFIVSLFAVLIIWIWVYLLELFVNFKFNRVFMKEIVEFKELVKKYTIYKNSDEISSVDKNNVSKDGEK